VAVVTTVTVQVWVYWENLGLYLYST